MPSKIAKPWKYQGFLAFLKNILDGCGYKTFARLGCAEIVFGCNLIMKEWWIHVCKESSGQKLQVHIRPSTNSDWFYSVYSKKKSSDK